jgi:hypothetical protein
MPHKHYETKVIETAIAAAEEEGSQRLNASPADDSTVGRWVKQYKERGTQAVGWLRSILFAVYGTHVSTLDMQNKSLLKQLTSLVQKFHALGSGGVIGRVNCILTKYYSGFI